MSLFHAWNKKNGEPLLVDAPPQEPQEAPAAMFDLAPVERESEPDLELEGQAIANILAVMHQLPRKSRDRVLTVVIDLAAPGPMSHPGFQHPASDQIVANLEQLRRTYGEGDDEA